MYQHSLTTGGTVTVAFKLTMKSGSAATTTATATAVNGTSTSMNRNSTVEEKQKDAASSFSTEAAGEPITAYPVASAPPSEVSKDNPF